MTDERMTIAVRLRRAAAAAAAGLLSILASAPAVSAQGSGCSGVRRVDAEWTRISAPAFSQGTSTLTAYAVSADTDTLFATNGVVVAASYDRGCTWSTVYVLPSSPTASPRLLSPNATIDSIVTGVPGTAYLVITDAGHPHVVATHDNGSTWDVAETGIVGGASTPTPAQLVVAPSGSTLYLLTSRFAADLGDLTSSPDGNLPGIDVLFVSTDSGETWKAQPLQPALVAAGAPATVRARRLAVQPTKHAGLWLATSAGLWSSSNGGAAWTSVDTGGTGPLDAVAVGARAGAPGEFVAAFDSERSTAYLSTNAGSSGSWSSIPTPGPVTGAGASPTENAIYAVTSGGGLYAINDRADGFTRTWRGSAPLRDPQVALGTTGFGASTPRLYACSCRSTSAAIYVHTSRLGPSKPPAEEEEKEEEETGPIVKGDCRLPSRAKPGRDWGHPSIDPATRSISLNMGQSVTVAAPVYLPPRRMDLFFLADMGENSRYTYCPMKYAQIVVPSLLGQVRNLHVGLGQFGDYPGYDSTGLDRNFPLSPGSDTTVYSRVRPIGPVDSSLALASAHEPTAHENGTPTGDGGGLPALFQAATGAGQPVYIRAGLQAGFDPASYNVVLTLALTHFRSPSNTSGYPGPAFDTVVAALRRHAIRHVGIWVQNHNKEGQADVATLSDLRALSTATGGVATKAVDCRVSDSFRLVIQPGEPLVCPYTSPKSSTHTDPQLASEILAILTSLQDVQPVRLVILGGGGRGIRVSPSTYPGVDLLTAHRLPAKLRLGCSGLPGTRVVRIGAQASGRLLATTSVRLTCVAPAAIDGTSPTSVPPPPPPPPPPPAPISNPNPAPRPVNHPVVEPAPIPAQAPQAQAQAQAIGQAVVVPQPEVQPQLAYQRVGSQSQQQEAMSALRPAGRRSLRTAQWVALGGGSAMFAFGCALRRRVVHSWVRNGRAVR